jgi:hypothetical protein
MRIENIRKALRQPGMMAKVDIRVELNGGIMKMENGKWKIRNRKMKNEK